MLRALFRLPFRRRHCCRVMHADKPLFADVFTPFRAIRLFSCRHLRYATPIRQIDFSAAAIFSLLPLISLMPLFVAFSLLPPS